MVATMFDEKLHCMLSHLVQAVGGRKCVRRGVRCSPCVIVPLWREMPLTDLSDNGVSETKAGKRYRSPDQNTYGKCGKKCVSIF